MKRKRIKYVANIDFDYRSITDAKQHIKIFANRVTIRNRLYRNS